jgi:hypothetical protein
VTLRDGRAVAYFCDGRDKESWLKPDGEPAATPAGTVFDLAGFSGTGAVKSWPARLTAFLLTVPVALHCPYALGFQTYETRVLWHSLLGCFFFGVFSAKMLLLRSERLPGRLLPIVGGLVFTALTVVRLTSALWFFRTFGVTTYDDGFHAARGAGHRRGGHGGAAHGLR